MFLDFPVVFLFVFCCFVFVFTLELSLGSHSSIARGWMQPSVTWDFFHFIIGYYRNALAVHWKSGDRANPLFPLNINGMKTVPGSACQDTEWWTDWPAILVSQAPDLIEAQHPPRSASWLCFGADWNCIWEHTEINWNQLPSYHPG